MQSETNNVIDNLCHITKIMGGFGQI